MRSRISFPSTRALISAICRTVGISTGSSASGPGSAASSAGWILSGRSAGMCRITAAVSSTSARIAAAPISRGFLARRGRKRTSAALALPCRPLSMAFQIRSSAPGVGPMGPNTLLTAASIVISRSLLPLQASPEGCPAPGEARF